MKAFKSLIFIIVILSLLALISFVFPEEGITIGNKKFYFANIHDIVYKESYSDKALKHMLEMQESLRMDSIARAEAAAYQDTLDFYTHFFQTYPARFHLPADDYEFFFSLFENLEQARDSAQLVHILHYGDSQIEGDRITAFFRQKMQEKFGGQGTGLIPAIQAIPTPSVGQSASGNIMRYILSGMDAVRAPHRRYGALGQLGQMYGESSISVNSRNWDQTFENVKEFSQIRLYAGKTENFKANLSANGTNYPPTELKENLHTKIYSWNMETPIKKFTLRMSGAGDIYGVAVDGKSGVAVDNIPFRGSSGTFFCQIDSMSLKPMLEDLNVGLIMMQFGGNMMPVTKSDKVVADYKTKMSQQIAYLQSIYPKAKVLLIGPSDMCTTVNGKLQTYPYLEKMVQGLKEAAHENNAAFWSIYDAMGGKNSMIAWVKGSPSLAATDYIHFNMRGANKIAELFYESLMVYYDYYQFQQNYYSRNAEEETEFIETELIK